MDLSDSLFSLKEEWYKPKVFSIEQSFVAELELWYNQ